jgi:chromosomal replication initiator protein
VDVLLLDDVQFLQGKEKTQEEFFHTFNALYLAGKQIVLTCDRFPSELHDFQERLRSRFENGLTASIAPPDRELRVAILRQRAAQMSAQYQSQAQSQTLPGADGAANLHVPLDVLYYLADHLRNNVRELEGALHKLFAHARLGKRPIDLGLARAALGPIIELPSRHLTVEVIQRVTAQHFGLRVTDLKGAKRHRGVVVPRMIAVWLTRKHTQASFPEIGRSFGGRDHSTAIHACQKVDWLVQTDPVVQAAIQAIETALGK